MNIEAKGLTVDLSRAVWQRSRQSDGADNCVEVAFIDDAIAVRDARDPDGPALIYTRGEWEAFIGGVKDGEFDE